MGHKILTHSARLTATLAMLFAASCTKSADLTLQERTVTSVSAASGGRAVSADGKLVLAFPAGALTVDREITITTRREVTNARLGSLAYALGPEGLTFAKPVPIAITIDSDRSGAYAVGNFDGATPIVVEGSTWDAEAKTARASLAHFSTYGAITLYTACAGKGCGDPCTVCDPAVPSCIEPAPEAKRCDQNGQCLDATSVACSSDPPDADDGGAGAALGEPCRTDVDCANDAKCLYWEAGCDRMGRCERSCPGLDACGGCNEHCGCDGVSFHGCADRPFEHRGSCVTRPDGSVLPPDAGAFCTQADGGRLIPAGMHFVSDDGAFCRCRIDQSCWNGCNAECSPSPGVPPTRCASGDDCPSGTCLFDPGCEPGALGYCVTGESSCSGPPSALDGGIPFFAFCGCNGGTYDTSCVTVPYAHEGLCPEPTDGGM